MTQGITLLCIGSPQYGYFSANMAMSIKAINPDIPIQLIHEPHSLNYLGPEYLRFFDIFTRIDPADFLLQGKFSPGKAKFSLYKYFAFDETVYFDSDAVAIKDVAGLFEDCRDLDFATQVHGRASISDDEFKANQWATMETVREFYPFPAGAIMPATNTSFIFARKSGQAEKVFSTTLENMADPIPIPRIKTWGGGQPDELYLNITLAQLGIMPEVENPHPVYLRSRRTQGEYASLEDLQARHYAVGVYGDLGYNHHSVIGMYERINKVNSLKMVGRHQEFKIQRLMEHKWVRNKK